MGPLQDCPTGQDVGLKGSGFPSKAAQKDGEGHPNELAIKNAITLDV